MSFIFKGPPKLIRTSHPIVRITESLKTAATAAEEVPSKNDDANAIVLDARQSTTLSDLTWLYKTAQKHSGSAAFRKPGGRVVILRSSSKEGQQDPEKATASEAIVGFAKSLAKENGTRGATVNLLCDETKPQNNNSSSVVDACSAPLDWLLSHGSCYVTGQELTVAKSPSTTSAKPGAILVTGAAGAIGKATAEHLHKSEEDVPNILLVDHPSTEKKLDQIATSLSDRVDVLPMDLTHSDASDMLVKEGVKLGGLERIIHAAGITRDKTLRNMEYESSWWPVMQVNLEAALNIDRALLNSPGALWKKGSDAGSSFVYFSSTSGIAGNAGQSNYAASKSGLLGYAIAMGNKYPEHSFRVVSPGFIATDMTAKMPWLVRMIASRLNALGQAGKPEDIAAAVAFLSSREASGLTPGINLRVCGLFMGGR